MAGPISLYTFKISIKHTKPPIWRRVTIPGSATLEDLHFTIQTVFDWFNSHLHEFEIGQRRFATPEHWEEDADRVEDESKVRLDGLKLKKGQSFLYTYDFGDGWEHAIQVEDKRETTGPAVIRCTAGRRRAPMEDSGGPWGWANVVRAVNDPSHPEHEELLEWAGGPIDPAELDLDEINAALAAPSSGRNRDLF